MYICIYVYNIYISSNCEEKFYENYSEKNLER